MSGSVDWRTIGEALAAPGMDLRNWLSYGTVAVMDDEGELHYDDPHAIHQGPEGVEVDVYIETLDKVVTCHYSGIQGGTRVYVGAPIGPGDRVMVGFPEGDDGGCCILGIANSAADPVPLGPDKKPIFQNDRLLVWSKSVPIDLRTSDKARVLMEQDGTVTVTAAKIKQGSPSASEHGVLGDQWTTQWQSLLTGLQTYIAAIQSVADPSGLATSTMAATITQLQAQRFLSPKVTLE